MSQNTAAFIGYNVLRARFGEKTQREQTGLLLGVNGKKHLGVIRRKWEDNIKICLKEK